MYMYIILILKMISLKGKIKETFLWNTVSQTNIFSDLSIQNFSEKMFSMEVFKM